MPTSEPAKVELDAPANACDDAAAATCGNAAADKSVEEAATVDDDAAADCPSISYEDVARDPSNVTRDEFAVGALICSCRVWVYCRREVGLRPRSQL